MLSFSIFYLLFSQSPTKHPQPPPECHRTASLLKLRHLQWILRLLFLIMNMSPRDRLDPCLKRGGGRRRRGLRGRVLVRVLVRLVEEREGVVLLFLDGG